MTLYFVAIHIGSLDRRDVCRSRHVLDNSVQKLLNTLISVRGTTANRNSCTLACCLTKNSLQILNRDGCSLVLKVLHHQVIIQLTDLLDQLLVIKLCFVLHVLRNLCDGDVLALLIVVDVGLHLEQVDNSLELVFLTNRKLQTDSILAKSCLNHIYCIVEICSQDIHLVDECHTRYIVGISLTPYVLRLRLYTTLRTEHADSAVQYTKGTLYLNRKVYVARGINDIDTVL